jgi:methylenetetrahydrofolate--tRNA-(uracil-5-)-methyltransferase
MRPLVQTPAHATANLAEVVCSNSFGGEGGAAGILKAELEMGGSLILECAHASRVPAGGALAVDRGRFSELVSVRVESHPNVELAREEATELPDGRAVIATGPLTSPALAGSLQARLGQCLFFFDAVAPIVTQESIDPEKTYAGGRYGHDTDYLNCPMNKEEYLAFHATLVSAERVMSHGFEEAYFESCMPVEVLAARGVDTLRFGPMRPVGLPDPRTGREPYAAVQLRRDNREGTLYNLVGFQTGLKWGEQARILRMIPGLENAEVARFGVTHRNIYVNAPVVLDGFLRLKESPHLFLAGQITGVEGYMESTAMGLAAGIYAAMTLSGSPLPPWPRETAIGSLLNYLRSAETDSGKTFQPMNANLGVFPPLSRKIKDKKQKARETHARAVMATQGFFREMGGQGLALG